MELFVRCHLLAAQQQLKEQVLEKLPVAMLIGLSQGRAPQPVLHAQMDQFARAAAKIVTGLPQ